jgi:hypothetical protein
MALVALIRVANPNPRSQLAEPPFTLQQQPATQCVNPHSDTLQYNHRALPPTSFFICFAGNTADRPSSSVGQYPAPRFGDCFFDQTLGKVIWYFEPGHWIDETGSTV